MKRYRRERSLRVVSSIEEAPDCGVRPAFVVVVPGVGCGAVDFTSGCCVWFCGVTVVWVEIEGFCVSFWRGVSCDVAIEGVICLPSNWSLFYKCSSVEITHSVPWIL